MNPATPQEIQLADYQAPGYTTRSVTLEFDIGQGETVVKSRLSIERADPSSSEIYLDGEELTLLGVELDGRTLQENEYSVDDEGLTIFGLDERHEVTITTKIHPEQNTALEGLYRSSKMYCTQCEAQGFRKITYYQDRPDVLAKFKTTIRAEADYPTLLSNGNLLEQKDLADGRREVTWEDPFPKPSYLFALVAGDLEVMEDTFTTMSGRTVSLKIFSEAHNIDQCAYAMDVLKRSMKWDEEVYGREYDLDIFMIVAVEDFNMGAMENKGLNIFNTSCVLASADTATDAAYQRVEAVVAHEYFHNWSGNRVTCRDWFQLSLKEGFTVLRDADFSSDMNSRAVKRIEDVSFLRSIQFAEDAGPLAHPVRPQSYIEISNFYTTTIYEKGAEVVRMYRTLLGAEKFRAGTDLYFARHDGQAVTTDDFAAVMAEVGQRDLAQFKRWYDQAGTPRLEIKEEFADHTLKLTIRQLCPATPNQPDKLPFVVPIALGMIDPQGQPVSYFDLQVDCDSDTRPSVDGYTLMLEMVAEQTELSLSYLEDKPVVSFLREFSAPVKVTYPRPTSELGFLAQYDSDGFVRWDALQSLWLSYFQGERVAVVELVCELAQAALEQNTAESKQLSATMLGVPDPNYLFEQIPDFDLDGILKRRELVLGAMASEGESIWRALYDHCSTAQPHAVDAQCMADRSLKNIALQHLVPALSADEAAQMVTQHYEQADNLTDRRAALFSAINAENIGASLREALLQDFYERWQQQALVIDLWFSLQAQSGATDLDQLRALADLPAFDVANPNRARALYAAFGMHNHKRFHAIDGSGYQYLAGAIAHIDTLNPQLASRLATPLTRWGRYDAQRQNLMKSALDGLAGKESISKDLFEIVSKSLAQ